MSTRSSAPGSWRCLLPAALACLAVLATACGPTSAADSPSTSTEARSVRFEVDGRTREYLLHPAQGLPAGARSAVVVVLHQEGGTPAGVAAETALAALRDNGATLVYPAGVDRSWDAGACCGTPRKAGVDDVEFVDALLADVARRTAVDDRRTALVGYSSGGMLTYRYVCARPGRLAAAVVVSGSLESPCSDQISVPDVLAVHGQLDGTIGLVRPVFIKALGLAPRPAVASLGIFTRSAGCSSPRTTRLPDAEQRRWEDCRGGDVEALLVPDAGHGWGNLDASRRTRDFLMTHLLAG